MHATLPMYMYQISVPLAPPARQVMIKGIQLAHRTETLRCWCYFENFTPSSYAASSTRSALPCVVEVHQGASTSGKKKKKRKINCQRAPRMPYLTYGWDQIIEIHEKPAKLCPSKLLSDWRC